MVHEDRTGKTVRAYYKGGPTGEQAIDDHSTGRPEELIVGVGQLPKGLDEALLDMEVGEERTVVILPEKGFGPHDPHGVQIYPRAFIDNGDRLKAGDAFPWINPASGCPIPVRVVEADDQLVTIDFNHPFAGKELTYWVKLVSVGQERPRPS